MMRLIRFVEKYKLQEGIAESCEEAEVEDGDEEAPAMNLGVGGKAEQCESEKLHDPRKVVRLRVSLVPSHLVAPFPDVEVQST